MFSVKNSWNLYIILVFKRSAGKVSTVQKGKYLKIEIIFPREDTRAVHILYGAFLLCVTSLSWVSWWLLESQPLQIICVGIFCYKCGEVPVKEWICGEILISWWLETHLKLLFLLLKLILGLAHHVKLHRFEWDVLCMQSDRKVETQSHIHSLLS